MSDAQNLRERLMNERANRHWKQRAEEYLRVCVSVPDTFARDLLMDGEAVVTVKHPTKEVSLA